MTPEAKAVSAAVGVKKGNKKNMKKETKTVVNPRVDMKGPAINYAESLRELFKQDPDIRMGFNDKTYHLVMEVKDPVKMVCLRYLLPEKKLINGKETVYIDIKLANRRGGEKYIPEIVEAAFKGNPLYVYKHTWDNPEATNCPFCWMEMAKEVIQYPADDLSALYGDRSVLPAELAKEILGEQVQYIFFDTINPDRPPVPDDEGHGPFGGKKSAKKKK